ncbi:hypothetical protein [Streptomyces prunicolor]|uniref:hypothetical protein n=1 Tax=Streptomyces prunicolor TaxID=67348 RepID=UPI0033D594D1
MLEIATLTGAASVGDRLLAWYEQAQAAAATQEQKKAAAVIYFAARVASAVAALDLEFRTVLNEIKKPDPTWSETRRDQLADRVQALATSESRLNQLQEAAGFLRECADPGGGWRERIRLWGSRNARFDEALDHLLASGERVLQLIGADRQAPTPYEVYELELKIRSSGDQQSVAQTKAEAARVLDVIDHLTARSVPLAFGTFAGALSRRHGIAVPDWAVGVS